MQADSQSSSEVQCRPLIHISESDSISRNRSLNWKMKNCNGFQLNVLPILESVLEPTESLTHALNPQATLLITYINITSEKFRKWTCVSSENFNQFRHGIICTRCNRRIFHLVIGVKIQNKPVTDGDKRASRFTRFSVSAKAGCMC